jgi:hypothetical protein
MRAVQAGIMAAAVLTALGASGCGKLKPNDPRADSSAKAQSRRQQAACASPTATDRLKGFLFDAAVAQHDGDRANLDTLADYSLVRLEEPVVTGWESSLDITKCRARLIVSLPPGAERGFGGEHQLRADIAYTAQASADGTGYVYRAEGTDAMIARLAAFNLKSRAYQPPPAIDPTGREVNDDPGPQIATASGPAVAPAPTPGQSLPSSDARLATASGEGAVRAFYGALGAGDGAAASALIIPEKRIRGAFTPAAMSRFYGRLPDPLRLTEIAPAGPGAFRVRYHYSAGRSQCDGRAIVAVTQRDGRALIRSIRALSGC